MRLTEGQIEMLWRAVDDEGVSKGEVLSENWRNLDQLERRKLVARIGNRYVVTEAGRDALSQQQ
jgi:hypothetical protein